MKTTTFKEESEWMKARAGKITGSTLKDIISTRGTRKIGFYKLIAERIAIPADDENRMDRGHRLEEEAIERFTKETGKKVNTDLILWQRDDNPNIALSPDGVIGKKEAVEVKCLASERHVEALITNKIPKEYELQARQYFCVNDDLKTLHFVMYDPRMPVDYLCFTVERADIAEDIETYLAFQRDTLKEVDSWVDKLTF